MHETQQRTIKLTVPQAAFWTSPAWLKLCEGAIRSGKSWVGVVRVLHLCEAQPGLQALAARFQDVAMRTQLLPLVRELMPPTLLANWNAEQECFDLVNGSKLFMRGLKPGEQQAQWSKLAGMTLGAALVDEAAELPPEFFDYLVGRISQPKMRHELILLTNPASENHWLSNEFPEDPALMKPGRARFTFDVYSNVENLGREYVERLEQQFPAGSAQRRKYIEGRRGPDVTGTAVYAGSFDRARHVRPVALNPQLPLIESWDFGFHFPCVTWSQYAPWGQLSILGGIMGEDLPLVEFVEIVAAYRDRWFPNRGPLWATADPAGAAQNSQGLSGTPLGVLKQFGVNPTIRKDANQPETRLAAVDIVAAYMKRKTLGDAEAFACDDARWFVVGRHGQTRQMLFVPDALEAGYRWDDRERHSARLGSFVVPLQDGVYCHGMNTIEYAVLCYVREVPPSISEGPQRLLKFEQQRTREQERHARRQLREAQRDTDEWDQRSRVVPLGTRGGYVNPNWRRR